MHARSFLLSQKKKKNEEIDIYRRPGFEIFLLLGSKKKKKKRFSRGKGTLSMNRKRTPKQRDSSGFTARKSAGMGRVPSERAPEVRPDPLILVCLAAGRQERGEEGNSACSAKLGRSCEKDGGNDSLSRRISSGRISLPR